MGHLGLEPRTIRLKAEYSTIELATLIYIDYTVIRLLLQLFLPYFFILYHLDLNLLQYYLKWVKIGNTDIRFKKSNK